MAGRRSSSTRSPPCGPMAKDNEEIRGPRNAGHSAERFENVARQRALKHLVGRVLLRTLLPQHSSGCVKFDRSNRPNRPGAARIDYALIHIGDATGAPGRQNEALLNLHPARLCGYSIRIHKRSDAIGGDPDFNPRGSDQWRWCAGKDGKQGRAPESSEQRLVDAHGR